VYLPCEQAAEVADDQMAVSWTARTVDFRVVLAQGPKVFKLIKLQSDIKGCTVRKKADKIQLVLEKAEEMSWYRLVAI